MRGIREKEGERETSRDGESGRDMESDGWKELEIKFILIFLFIS